MTASVEEVLRRRKHLLPASPQILVELQRVLDDGRSGAAEVSRVLRHDPALVATVLRVVNSAFYGLPHPIQRVTIAVAYLGTAEIHRLVVAAAVVNAFNDADLALLEPFWYRAHLTGLLARRVVRDRATWLSQSLAWTLGLLHDVGTLVRIRLDPLEQRRLRAYRREHGSLDEEAEIALGLVPTPTLGAALCRAWQLPGPLELVIRSARTGIAPAASKAETAEYVRIICAASTVAHLTRHAVREEVGAIAQSRVSQALDCDDDYVWELVNAARELQPEAIHTVRGELLPKRI